MGIVYICLKQKALAVLVPGSMTCDHCMIKMSIANASAPSLFLSISHSSPPSLHSVPPAHFSPAFGWGSDMMALLAHTEPFSPVRCPSSLSRSTKIPSGAVNDLKQ